MSVVRPCRAPARSAIGHGLLQVYGQGPGGARRGPRGAAGEAPAADHPASGAGGQARAAAGEPELPGRFPEQRLEVPLQNSRPTAHGRTRQKVEESAAVCVSAYRARERLAERGRISR